MKTNSTYYYDNNYEVEKEYCFSGLKINLYGLVFAVVVGLISLYLFRDVFGHPFAILSKASQAVTSMTQWGSIANGLLILGAFLLGIFIHECIHAVCFAVYNKAKFKSVQMGVIWKHCMPYARCPEPISVKHTYVILLMPTLLLGFLPLLAAFYTGHVLLWFWATCFIAAGVGDFMICWSLLKLDANHLVGAFQKRKMGFVLLKVK